MTLITFRTQVQNHRDSLSCLQSSVDFESSCCQSAHPLQRLAFWTLDDPHATQSSINNSAALRHRCPARVAVFRSRYAPPGSNVSVCSPKMATWSQKEQNVTSSQRRRYSYRLQKLCENFTNNFAKLITHTPFWRLLPFRLYWKQFIKLDVYYLEQFFPTSHSSTTLLSLLLIKSAPMQPHSPPFGTLTLLIAYDAPWLQQNVA